MQLPSRRRFCADIATELVRCLLYVDAGDQLIFTFYGQQLFYIAVDMRAGIVAGERHCFAALKSVKEFAELLPTMPIRGFAAARRRAPLYFPSRFVFQPPQARQA